MPPKSRLSPRFILLSLSLAVALLLALSSCRDRVFACDDYVDGVCREKRPANVTYDFKLEADRAVSWRTLSDYMYFHSRQTPGIRYDFGAALSAARLEQLNKTLHCSYELEKQGSHVRGEIEGRRIDEDGGGWWCFDYLGAMLKKYHKTYGSLEQKPDPGFFPVELRIIYKSSLKSVNGVHRSQIKVRWSSK